MRFKAFATDYDGTLAHHGTVSAPAIQALQRLRAAGWRCLLVTGRELKDLKLIFPRMELFDLVVAENGALLYDPRNEQAKPLHAAPPPELAKRLLERGVTPLSVGNVVVATFEPFEKTALDVIKELGLELEIIFNKGAVMILPTGCNKATGLKAALKSLGLSPDEAVAIGDAENDHALLRAVGFGVAVANAVPALKEQANMVTAASHGDGVIELIDLLLIGGLSSSEPASKAQALK